MCQLAVSCCGQPLNQGASFTTHPVAGRGSLLPLGCSIFNFLSIHRRGRQIPWGFARGIFQGSQGLKFSFLGGQDKFSRLVIPVRSSQGMFRRVPDSVPDSGPVPESVLDSVPDSIQLPI